MKNFLTKAFVCAGVLASAMALSSVATFAAVGTNTVTFTHGASTYTSGVHYYTSTGTSTTATTGDAYFTVNLTGDRSNTSTASYLAIGSKNDTISFTTTEPKAAFSITVSGEVGANARNITFDIPSGADAVDEIALAKNATKDTYNRTLSKAGTYTVKFSGGSAPAVYSISVIETESTDPELSLDKTALYNLLSDSKITLTATTKNVPTGGYVEWSSSDDITINPTVGNTTNITAGSTIKSKDTATVTATLKDSTGATVQIDGKDVATTCTIDFKNIYSASGTYSPYLAGKTTIAATGAETFKDNGDGTFELTAGGEVTLTASTVPNYIGTSTFTISQAGDDYEFDTTLGNTALVATNDGTNVISETKFNSKTTGNSNRPYFTNNYTVNGFELNLNGSNANMTSGRIQIPSGTTITYTPASNGTISVYGGNTGNNNDRGYTITGTKSDTSVTYPKNSTPQTENYEVVKGSTVVITANGGINITSVTFTASETGKVSEALAPITGLTATDGLECAAKYAKVDDTHYLVLDFTKNDALADANALAYSVTGKTPITIDTLYTSVQFDSTGDDAIREDNHLYYAFKFDDADNTYTGVTATISVAN